MKDDKNPASIDFYPFAYALANSELKNHCWYCLREKYAVDESFNLKACSGCHIARFCGANCQRQGWLDHRPECGALKKTRDNGDDQIPDIDVRLLGSV
jgi:hypothetical protein